MAGFNIKIGADTVQLTKNLAELRKDLAGFQKQLSTSLDPGQIVKLNQAIAQTDRQIKSLSGAQNIKAIGRDMKELPAGFNQAGFAVGNFSRIVQDAPFALLQGNLIAVSNNIDPLIQSFVQLKQQTGSGVAAFKALGNSLLGSGGLLLGFSLVNAAITFFSARSMYAKDKTKELADTIRDSAQVQSDAAASTAGQIAQVNALASVISDTNNSYTQRKRALEELRGVNKAYFGDLQLEDAATGKLTKTINEYAKALINAATVKEFSQEIAKTRKEVFDADTELAKATTKLTNAEKDLARARAESRPTGREGTGVSGAEADAQSELSEAFTKQREAREKVLDLQTRELLLTNGLNKAIADGTKLKGLDADKTTKETDALKERISALKQLQSDTGLTEPQRIELAQLEIQLASRDAVKLRFTPEELQQRIQSIVDSSFPEEKLTALMKIRVIGELDDTDPKSVKLKAADFNKGKALNIAGATGSDSISRLSSLIKLIQEAQRAQAELLKQDKLEAFAGAVTNILTPAFTDFFTALQTDGANAFEEFGRAIVKIIQRLIAAAAAAAALAGIFTLITGGNAAAFKASFKGIFGGLTGFQFASGGIVNTPTRGVFGESGPEAIIPLSRLPQLMAAAGGGGGYGGEMTARIVDGGRDLLLIMSKANQTFGRNF
jgi:hypothetical protein